MLWKLPSIEQRGRNRTAFNDWKERLQRLDPILTPIADFFPPIKNPWNKSKRSGISVIYDLLSFHFLGAGTQRVRRRSEAERERTEQDTEAALVVLKRNPPDFVARAVTEWLDTLQGTLNDDERSRATTFLSCPILSAVITDLGNYLFNVRPLREPYPAKADLYRLIGHLIATVTTPDCLACGRSGGHPFVDDGWRNIWKRDTERQKR